MIMLLCYLLGSIQFGYVLSCIFNIKNPYLSGSKNTGATNMWRINGAFFGLVTFILDVLKVYVAFIILKKTGVQDKYLLVYTSLSVIGHMYPAFNIYKGGKGIACYVAILSLFYHWALLLFIFVWSIIKFTAKHVGVASVVSVAVSCIYIYSYELSGNMIINNTTLLMIGLLIIFKHKENIISFLRYTD